MSSTKNEQWEVVTKSKKQKNFEKKVSAHTEQKRIAAQLPKLEELLPQQYRFSGINNNNNKTHSPAKSNSSSSSSKNKSPRKSNTTKTTTTSNTDNGKKQPKQAAASSKPRSLEQAMRQITPDDFAAQLAQVKLSCPGSELRWLSNIALYFNRELSFDCDPTFSGRSCQYPSILASVDLKQTIIEFLSSVGETNLEYFFYSLLDSMTIELNNNQNVVGYKFMLQLIGQNWPSICLRNMAKTAMLRNSYQNRNTICLSILWAIGQGGFQSLTEGVKVWQNLFYPNLELKNYTKYAVEYMERILAAASTRRSEVLALNQQEFFASYNALNAPYTNMSKDFQQNLKRSAGQLLQIYIASSTKHANIFLTLLREISMFSKQRNEIQGCISCLLSKDADDCFKVWRMNYKRQQLASLLLLQAIENDWEHSTNQLVKTNAFKDFLEQTHELNGELLANNRKENYAEQLNTLNLVLQEKTGAQQKKNKQQSAAQTKKCGCCKWVLGSIFIVALIAGALCYDTEVNGKGVFEKSATGKVLKNAGVLPHVQKGWYATMGASARGYKWAEQHVPPYAEPVIKLSSDLFKVLRNCACAAFDGAKGHFVTKWPVVAKFIDQYVPNLSTKLEAFAVSTKDLVINSYDVTITLFKEKVLVGRLSPENINQALNQTRNAALEYYNQFNKKVDAYAKLK